MKNYWILLAGILLAGGSAEALEFRQARKQMGALKVLDLKKPVIELSGKSGAQNKKSYYVCGSLYLASPQDFRGKQLRVKAAALQGAEKTFLSSRMTKNLKILFKKMKILQKNRS